MGWEQRETRIRASLSRHGGDLESRHLSLWRELLSRLDATIDDPTFFELFVERD